VIIDCLVSSSRSSPVGVALVAIPALEGGAKPTGDPAVFVKQVVGYIVADD
jgi:hypothetical protein